jgi:hypothetical protein
MAPEEEEQEEEVFEPAEDEETEEFESVEEEKEPEVVEEFEGFDENAPDDISTSGFKTKGGDIPDYEPTVDEVLSYAMGKTRDPSQPATTMAVEMDDGDDLPEDIEEALDELLEDMAPAEGEEKEEGTEETEEVAGDDELADIFDEDEDKE